MNKSCNLFFEGLLSLFNWSGKTNNKTIKKIKIMTEEEVMKRDCENLKSDWQKVFGDFEKIGTKLSWVKRKA